MLIAPTVSLLAENTTPPVTPPGVDLGGGSTTIYYGTEASTNPNNPCKGATTRKCAVISTNSNIGDNGETTETTEVRDANGNIISRTTKILPSVTK